MTREELQLLGDKMLRVSGDGGRRLSWQKRRGKIREKRVRVSCSERKANTRQEGRWLGPITHTRVHSSEGAEIP